MFEFFEDIAAAWRTIVHVSEWSGLSIGLLILLILAFLYVPKLRKGALIGAPIVALCWLCLIHGDRVGRADVEAQWADARQAAIEADRDRDSMIEDKLEGTYGPELQRLAKLAADNKARANDVESKNAKLAAKTAGRGKAGDQAGGACNLGAVAARLRGSQGEAGKLPAR